MVYLFGGISVGALGEQEECDDIFVDDRLGWEVHSRRGRSGWEAGWVMGVERCGLWTSVFGNRI
jgi:hypothetical protein